MSRMLEAQAEMSSRPSFELPRRPPNKVDTVEETESSSLAVRLMEIFEFEKPEEVINGQCPSIIYGILINIVRVPLLVVK